MSGVLPRDRHVLLYRRHLDARSGAGQLVAMQAQGLREAGIPVSLAAERGRLKFFLRTAQWPRRLPRLGDTTRKELIVDHSATLDSADIVFVHSLYSAAARYVERSDWDATIEAEARVFAQIDAATPIVANSRMIRTALVTQHELAPSRIAVLYPGYCSRRFKPSLRHLFRSRARASLGVADSEPLIGLIASGDLLTRGLDVFLDASSRIRREQPAAKFLVVGSRRLPEAAAGHRLAREGRLMHRPKSARPERWLAALDVFLHTSRFDAYGMVVAESLALGVPVITSERCGVAERLHGDYRRYVLAEPDPRRFAELALTLLSDSSLRTVLIEQGLRLVSDSTDAEYGRASARIIEGELGRRA